MKFEWNDAMSVGVDVIDEQHKGLFSLVKNLNRDIDDLCGLDSLTDKTKKMRIYMTILNLRTFFLEHFSTEERLMMKSRYPDFLEHKKEHDMFILKVFECERHFLEGKLAVAKEINDFLKMWVVKHTSRTDQKYASHFRKFLKPDESAPERLEEIKESETETAEPEPEIESAPQAQEAAPEAETVAEDKDILVDVEEGSIEERDKKGKDD